MTSETKYHTQESLVIWNDNLDNRLENYRQLSIDKDVPPRIIIAVVAFKNTMGSEMIWRTLSKLELNLSRN